MRLTLALILAVAVAGAARSQAAPGGAREGMIVTAARDYPTHGALLVPPKGTPRVVLQPKWSPVAFSSDGRIAATRATREANRPLAIVAGRSVTTVPNSTGAACVSWSSSGRRLAYVTGQFTWYERFAGTAAGGWVGSLWIVDASRPTAPRQVASGLFAGDECAQWAPRSETLAYMVGTVDSPRTWTVRTDRAGATSTVSELETPVPSNLYRTFVWMPRSDELLLLGDDGVTSTSNATSRVVVPAAALEQVAKAGPDFETWRYFRILSVSPNGRMLAVTIHGATGLFDRSGALVRLCGGSFMGWSGNAGIVMRPPNTPGNLTLCLVGASAKVADLTCCFKLTVVTDPGGRWFAYPDPNGVYVVFRRPNGSLLRRVALRTLYFNALAAVGRDGRVADPAGPP